MVDIKKWLDRLFLRQSDIEELRLREIASVGKALEEIVSNGSYAAIEEYILKPLEEGAFDAFSRVPASDSNAVIETQMAAKIIRQIRIAIESKIQEGRLAQHTLNNSTEEASNE